MPVSGGTFPINGTGPGFILPAGKSTTIKFSVTLNNPPNLSGVPPATPQVANHGTLSGSFSNNPVDTNTVTTNVDLFDSTTTVTSLPTSSNTGQSVTFTAAIGTTGTPSGSGTNRTGTVNFKVGRDHDSPTDAAPRRWPASRQSGDVHYFGAVNGHAGGARHHCRI